jgi:hypothetical protein
VVLGLARKTVTRAASSVEIEIHAGFCEPDGEQLGLLDRPDWQRISLQRRGEIVGGMVRLSRGASAGRQSSSRLAGSLAACCSAQAAAGNAASRSNPRSQARLGQNE